MRVTKGEVEAVWPVHAKHIECGKDEDDRSKMPLARMPAFAETNLLASCGPALAADWL